MSNTNRDLLMQVDVKNSSVKGGGFNFYITDKNTSNFFVQLVIDMSTNPVIHKYVAIENASDYKLILKCIKPNGQLLSIEGTLMNEEESLFQYNLTEEQKDVVGAYQCEYWIYSTVNEQEEIITTAPFNFTVKESIINKLDGVIEDSEDYPILLDLIEEVRELQANGGGGASGGASGGETHSHDNKETLDTITTEKVEKWDNPVIDDYGDTILVNIPVDTIWEAYEVAQSKETENSWFDINFIIPTHEYVDGEVYLIEFLGRTTPVISNEGYLYASELWNEEGYYVDPITGKWVKGQDSITLDWYAYKGLTKEEFTPFVIKKANVKKMDIKFLPNDLVIPNSISMERHIRSEIGAFSTALGQEVRASGKCSHAEGFRTKATGEDAHAEGYMTEATGGEAHAEGSGSVASGQNSHAQNFYTTASGTESHAEGFRTVASGQSSHAEGYYSEAKGKHSHAEGKYTIATREAQHVQGEYNLEDTEKKYLHIVGNGTSSTRSNAHTLDKDGNAWFSGNVTIGADNKELATKEYVDSILGDLEELLGGI